MASQLLWYLNFKILIDIQFLKINIQIMSIYQNFNLYILNLAMFLF